MKTLAFNVEGYRYIIERSYIFQLSVNLQILCRANLGGNTANASTGVEVRMFDQQILSPSAAQHHKKKNREGKKTQEN